MHFGQSKWLCRCDCGTEKVIYGFNLTHGGVRSCGCLKSRLQAELHFKHGDADHRRGEKIAGEYGIWATMKQKCFNENSIQYEVYGGRGITVCDRWKNSYPLFLQDMGRRPGPRYALLLINPNGNFEPGNCRWGTRKERAMQQRINGTTRLRRKRFFSDKNIEEFKQAAIERVARRKIFKQQRAKVYERAKNKRASQD